MRFWSIIARSLWRAATYLFLIVFSSIVGAQLGTWVGLVIAALAGDSSWTTHGQCAGWTLFVLVAAVGAPLGFVYFCDSKIPVGKKRRNRRTPPDVDDEPQSVGGEESVEAETIRGIKAVVVAPLLGAFMGLIVGGMAGGALVALYFFVALSPFGPGGWWPILPLTFEPSGDGFSTKAPFILFPWLIVVGAFVLFGIFLGLFGTVTVGKKRYQVFRSKKAASSSPANT